MKLPNFLIIGSAKSGTTSLYKYFDEHPEIYMSKVKEPKFFAFEEKNPDSFKGPGDSQWIRNYAVTDWQEYQNLFKKVTHEKAIGEATPLYLYYPHCPQKIKNCLPDAKLIAILRNPVDRAFSRFLHHVRDGFYQELLQQNNAQAIENCFVQLFYDSDTRIEENWAAHWHYKAFGYYYTQLQRYLEFFEPHQLKIFLFEDLQQDPQNLLKSAFNFLEVDENFVPSNLTQKYNVHKGFQKMPKNKKVHKFLVEKNPIKSMLKPLFPEKMRGKINFWLRQKNTIKMNQSLDVVLSSQTKQELAKVYQEEIMQLQDFLNRDLSHWLQ